ncbi:hypothetical protein PSPO01_13350 [Paraphaeosphaeria sporulosa]
MSLQTVLEPPKHVNMPFPTSMILWATNIPFCTGIHSLRTRHNLCSPKRLLGIGVKPKTLPELSPGNATSPLSYPRTHFTRLHMLCIELFPISLAKFRLRDSQAQIHDLDKPTP